MLHSNGYWHDEDCNLKCVTICQSDQGPVLITDEEMSWKQAQRFCRENFLDLYTVKTESENQLLRMMNQNDSSCIWIGLYRDSWKWSDQTNTSSSLRWAVGQPDNLFGSEICAAVDEDGRIADELCSRRFFFFCKSPLQGPPGHLNKAIRIIPQGKSFPSDILSKVQQKLQERGMAADVKVSWQEQPNGTVFQKLNEDQYR
ncbi:hypothetical protein G5714_008737 [Onychostoma macrolepis]|uniref:C-type lectin domain-containing protein n=1 Tax=Onychostoma macrolepis TaxID=369639 RepID=A0A7J6CWJ1_9TELE|nr:hypothetical protein G5714_008737 [Onychostoma macrolepis]